MKYKPLGRSGLVVSELCLGTMTFGKESERSTDEPMGLRMIDQFPGATGWTLTAKELERLDQASAIPESYPYRMMRVYGAR